MANLTKWNEPWLDRVFSDFFDSDRFFDDQNGHHMHPKVNVAEDEKEYRIEVQVPGMSKDDIHVNVEENRLVLTGEKKEEKEDKNKNYTRREFRTSSFSRSFMLPENANAEKIQAKFQDGILKLTLEKKSVEPSKKRREIQIG